MVRGATVNQINLKETLRASVVCRLDRIEKQLVDIAAQLDSHSRDVLRTPEARPARAEQRGGRRGVSMGQTELNCRCRASQKGIRRMPHHPCLTHRTHEMISYSERWIVPRWCFCPNMLWQLALIPFIRLLGFKLESLGADS